MRGRNRVLKMIRFTYTAKNNRGEEASGTLDATDVADALNRLRDQGLEDIRLMPVTESAREPERPPVALSSRESSDLMSRVAHVTHAGVPLAAGLRASASEIAGTRVARALCWIADQLDRGRPLEDILVEGKTLVPSYLSSLIAAAARTASWGETLLELVEHEQKSRSLYCGLARALIYPLVLMMIAAGVLLMFVWTTAGLREMMNEFGMQLPGTTLVLYWWCDVGWYVAGGFLLLVVAVAAAYRLLAGRVRWHRLASAFPLLGPLWHWSGVAEWSGLVSVLLRHEVPLPEALRLSGHGVRDAHVGQLSLRLADGVARGRSLSQMIFASRGIPATLIPVVEWGERSGALSESLRVGSELFAKRALVRRVWLEATVPSVFFIVVGCVFVFVVGSVFLPMIALIQGLS
jgi:type II secretory pathway component PulF